MTWWPVGWSREFGGKPLAVRVGTEELVLFRDHSGAAFAFEDRCPHRRVPLSLGKVTPEGTLQCGYHGWCYDGASGRCVTIPNFRSSEPISTRVAVRTYPTAEVQGWLLIETGGTAGGPSEAPPTLEHWEGPSDQQAGKVVVPLSQETWVEWLLTDPIRALGMAETCSLGDPVRLEKLDSIIFVSRPIMLTPAGERLRPPPRTTAAPLAGRCRVWSGSGLMELIATDRSQNRVFSLVVASVPLAAGETSVSWQVRTRVAGGAFSRFLAKVSGSRHSLVNIRADTAAASTRRQAGDVAAAWLELSSRNKSPLETASAVR